LLTEFYISSIWRFPSKILDREESSCIEHCADRYLQLRLRASEKFQYYQALKVQELAKDNLIISSIIGIFTTVTIILAIIFWTIACCCIPSVPKTTKKKNT